MLQRLRDIALLIRLGRVRGFEGQRDQRGALHAIEHISYEGPFAGLLATYTARLLLMTRDARALPYVRDTRRFIRGHKAALKYAGYCEAYCDYLECVLLQQPHDAARQKVLAEPSSPLVRNSLIVT